MLTWKVWTHQQNDPVFEGTEEQARTYIILHLPPGTFPAAQRESR